jgi:nucleoid-associated protein EbfC
MNINQLMKQAQNMQKKLAEAQEKVALIEVEGSSGGGMVSIKLNGKGKASNLKIDPKIIDPNDPEMLADLVTAAINNAVDKKDAETEKQMNAATGGMNLPAGLKLPF